MQFDAGNLGPAQLHHVVDVVDVVVFNQGKDPAHPADDAALLAVVNVAAANDMAADFFLQPAMVLPAANGIPLHLGGALEVVMGEILEIGRASCREGGEGAY